MNPTLMLLGALAQSATMPASLRPECEPLLREEVNRPANLDRPSADIDPQARDGLQPPGDDTRERLERAYELGCQAPAVIINLAAVLAKASRESGERVACRSEALLMPHRDSTHMASSSVQLSEVKLLCRFEEVFLAADRAVACVAPVAASCTGVSCSAKACQLRATLRELLDRPTVGPKIIEEAKRYYESLAPICDRKLLDETLCLEAEAVSLAADALRPGVPNAAEASTRARDKAVAALRTCDDYLDLQKRTSASPSETTKPVCERIQALLQRLAEPLVVPRNPQPPAWVSAKVLPDRRNAVAWTAMTAALAVGGGTLLAIDLESEHEGTGRIGGTALLMAAAAAGVVATWSWLDSGQDGFRVDLPVWNKPLEAGR